MIVLSKENDSCEGSLTITIEPGSNQNLRPSRSGKFVYKIKKILKSEVFEQVKNTALSTATIASLAYLTYKFATNTLILVYRGVYGILNAVPII